MKRSIVLSLIMAGMMLMAGLSTPAQAQSPAKDDTLTFYRLTPGVYVNGWPRFTVYYPKDWVERPPMFQETFRASVPGPVPSPALVVALSQSPVPLEGLADGFVKLFSLYATEVTIVSDKPSQLKDGTSAREFEHRMLRNGAPFNTLNLVTKKGGLLRIVGAESPTGKIGEDLRAILYSTEFQLDKDGPAKVPPDVQQFFDKHSNDIVSGDLAKVMANYSDRYLNSGARKGEVERMWRQMIGSWTSARGVITDFVAAGDRAFLTGFVITNLGPFQISETSIIRENGEWKFYGNQRDPAP